MTSQTVKDNDNIPIYTKDAVTKMFKTSEDEIKNLRRDNKLIKLKLRDEKAKINLLKNDIYILRCKIYDYHCHSDYVTHKIDNLPIFEREDWDDINSDDEEFKKYRKNKIKSMCGLDCDNTQLR